MLFKHVFYDGHTRTRDKALGSVTFLYDPSPGRQLVGRPVIYLSLKGCWKLHFTIGPLVVADKLTCAQDRFCLRVAGVDQDDEDQAHAGSQQRGRHEVDDGPQGNHPVHLVGGWVGVDRQVDE